MSEDAGKSGKTVEESKKVEIARTSKEKIRNLQPPMHVNIKTEGGVVVSGRVRSNEASEVQLSELHITGPDINEATQKRLSECSMTIFTSDEQTQAGNVRRDVKISESYLFTIEDARGQALEFPMDGNPNDMRSMRQSRRLVSVEASGN